jgi:hypothetical protein
VECTFERVLIREDVSTDVALVTRVLAHHRALAVGGRVAVRAGEVVYIAGRRAAAGTASRYDVAAVWLVDGYVLHGEVPEDIDRYLWIFRSRPDVTCTAISSDGAVVTGSSARECAAAALLRIKPELAGRSPADIWETAESEARANGALVSL